MTVSRPKKNSTIIHKSDAGEPRTPGDGVGLSSAYRDVGFSFLARFSTMFFSLVNQSVLAWFLGPSERGAYAVALIFANALGVFFILGIDQGAQYYIASGRMGRAEGTRTTLALGFVFAIAAVATGVLLISSDAEFFTKAPPGSFLIALAYIPLMILNVCVSMILMGLGDFKGMALVTVIGATSHVVFILVLVVGLGLGLEGALYCTIVSSLLQLLWSFKLLRKAGALAGGVIRWIEIRQLVWYGLRFYVGSITLAMNVQVGTVAIAFFANKEEIGIFSLAVDFITRVIMVPDIISQVVQPRVAMDPRGKPELVAQTARLVFVICAGIVIGILLTSWWLVPVLFSPEFESMIPLLWIMGLGVALRCVAKALTPFLNGTNRPGIFSIASLVGIIVNVGLILLLFPSARLLGAATALSCSFIASSVMIMYFFWRFSGLGLRATWMPTRSDAHEIVDALKRLGAKLAVLRSSLPVRRH